MRKSRSQNEGKRTQADQTTRPCRLLRWDQAIMSHVSFEQPSGFVVPAQHNAGLAKPGYQAKALCRQQCSRHCDPLRAMLSGPPRPPIGEPRLNLQLSNPLLMPTSGSASGQAGMHASFAQLREAKSLFSECAMTPSRARGQGAPVRAKPSTACLPPLRRAGPRPSMRSPRRSPRSPPCRRPRPAPRRCPVSARRPTAGRCRVRPPSCP